MGILDVAKERLAGYRLTLDKYLAPILPPTKSPIVNMKGKRVLVTGANTGIGYAVAKALAFDDAEVYLLRRNKEKAEQARDDLREETWNVKIEVEVIDLESLESVRQFVEPWGKRAKDERRIDVLFNNAGQTICTKNITAEGLEATYAINFLSAFLLTILLLQRGYFSPTARIIQNSSDSIYYVGAPNANDLNSTDVLKAYSKGAMMTSKEHMTLYARTKALQAVWTRELQERLLKSSRWKDVVVQSCYPGNVATSLVTRSTGVGGYGDHVVEGILAAHSYFGVSPDQGAVTPVWLATSEEATRPGVLGSFWTGRTVRWTPAWMEDDNIRRQLWRTWADDAQVDASDL